MKSPDLSYTVNAIPDVTFSFKNAVAPLLEPLINVGVSKVIGSFKVNSVIVWTS